MSEVLQAVESTIRLYNSFNEPLAWEIAKCEPPPHETRVCLHCAR